MLDLAIINGRVVSSAGVRALDVGVKAGRVAALAAPGSLPAAREVVDARGLLVLPGIVDTHVHCRAPERPDREDFDSVTAAAAAGGVTTIFEMPITTPCCATPEVLRDRMNLAEEMARVDVALYAAPGDLDRPRIAEMAELGAVAFKIFLHDAPANRREAFEGLAFPDPGDVYRALRLIQPTGRVCAFHAEDQPLIDVFEHALRAAGRNDPEAHADSRPAIAEAYAVARVGIINEQVGARVHICHVSSSLALETMRQYQARGQAMTGETTPAYLFLTREDVGRYGPFVKINPPLRSDADRQALWAALRDGTLSVVNSDHAPFRAEEKEAGWEDIWPVGSGLPGVEVTGRLLWNEALAGRIRFEDAAAWCSENPARLFGIDDQKGALVPGADADFVLFDPEAYFTFSRDRLFSRSGDSLRHLEGVTVRGDIRSTWVRGQMVFDGSRPVAAPGTGRVVRPATGGRG